MWNLALFDTNISCQKSSTKNWTTIFKLQNDHFIHVNQGPFDYSWEAGLEIFHVKSLLQKMGLQFLRLKIVKNLLIKGHFHVSFKIRFFLRGSSCRSSNCLIPMFHVKSLLTSLAETYILGNFIAGWSEHWNSTFIGTRISIKVITWDYGYNTLFNLTENFPTKCSVMLIFSYLLHGLR